MVLKSKISISAEEAYWLDHCPYCQGTKKLINHSKYQYGGVADELDLGLYADIVGNRLYVKSVTDRQSVKIKYCPMCGRRLKERDGLL